MDELLEIEFLRTKATEFLAIAQAYLTSLEFLAQIAVIAATGAVAYLVGKRVLRLVVRLIPAGMEGYGRRRIIAILGCDRAIWLVAVAGVDQLDDCVCIRPARRDIGHRCQFAGRMGCDWRSLSGHKGPLDIQSSVLHSLGRCCSQRNWPFGSGACRNKRL